MSHKFWQKSTSFIASGLLPFLFALFFFKEKGAEGVSQKLHFGTWTNFPEKLGCHENYPKGVSQLLLTTNMVEYQYFGRGLPAS